MRGKRKPVYRLLAVVLCICITMTQTSIVSAEDSREAALLNSRESDSGSISVYGAADSMDASGDEPAGDDGTSDDGTKGSQENIGNGTGAGTEAGKGAGTGADTGAGTEADKGADTSNDGNTAANDSDTSGDGTEDKADQTENKNEASENLDLYYKDGKICIYNYKQILLIGSGQQVHTGDIEENSDQGDVVRTENDVLTYGLDQKYYLMNDIEMDTSSLWEFPDAFTGTIEPYESREETGVYDEAADTIYIYNRYQLELMLSEDAEKELVMSEDWTAEKVGMGKVITLKDGSHLTYGKSHRYIIAASFTTETPELLAGKVNTMAMNPSDKYPSNYEGRDYFGQVVKTIGGENYILIGNEKQLRAIGTDIEVTEPIWKVYWEGASLIFSWEVVDDSVTSPTVIYYPGDADLVKFNEEYDWSGTELYSSSLYSDKKLGDDDYWDYDILKGHTKCYSYCSSKLDENKKLTYDTTKETNTNIGPSAKYTNAANYIIFRDIDLENKDWTPLMFSGTMIGAKSSDGQPLWNTDSTDIINTDSPMISNVTVNQTAEIDVSDYVGIGFFGTITNEINVNNVGVSAGTVKVSNLVLNNISVTNKADKVKDTQTILNVLTTGLGWLVGGLVDLLVGALSFGSVKLNLKDTLSGLLNARAEDKTIFATGAFAGRVVGDVVISNCRVTGSVQVTNVNDRTGGFIGYSEGVTEYSGLSDTLGMTEKVLSSLLNAIPGLGLGDLITVLLKNAIPLENLIPTGYKNPQITGCQVSGLTGTIGTDITEYSGGFIGQQVGTIITSSSVIDSTYTVHSKNYGGGFCGLSRDAEIKGTLSGVGIELIRLMQLQSLIMDSNITGCNITVSGGSYQGGFVGAQTNSYAVNDSMSGSISVEAAENYVGGFSGIATTGWVTNLGKDEVSDYSLLSVVKTLLTGLLGSDKDQAQMLLSLVGINPSAILGCQMNCSSVAVSAGGSYAGGILGSGDGVYLAESSPENLKQLAYWKYAENPSFVTQQACSITGLTSVSARKNYAGGIAGFVGTASVTGLLNNTLGLGEFLGFTLGNITVKGVENGFTVTAEQNYAGGGIGEAVGGTITEVTISEIASVSADNRAGGFVGCAGPGDLAGVGGLTLNLLGLDKLLTVKNLLSAGQGIEVKINHASVSGVTAGFTVSATGKNDAGGVNEYIAGGFIGKSNSTDIENGVVKNLNSVTADMAAGYAGGFVGTSESGGLADVSDETSVKSLIEANNLLTAVSYLIPSYTSCAVYYIDGGGVSADTAGGFAGDFKSGTVDNKNYTEAENISRHYAVYNIDHVSGGNYAGGFGGIVRSGGLAESDGGISILGGTSLALGIDSLLGLLNVYIPKISYAGVYSEKGFTVSAATFDASHPEAGSAGGFIGYGSGVQVSYCDVESLKYTTVTAPDDLEAMDASSYFSEKSAYAVTATRNAGGYIGFMDIGDAASVGKGLKVLGTNLNLANILSALSVVYSTIEHSNVHGAVGGFSVLASEVSPGDISGMAGGFAGRISGGLIQDSDCINFAYIIGQISAGGYVGEFEPGNVANLLDDASILNGLLSTENSLASVMEDFVPVIRNSSTTCIPCGGAVRAQAASDSSTLRGTAGGYVGHNEGGQILGLNSDPWKGKGYTEETSTCTVQRIRSVYGAEYAGGFSGLMEPADTASTGSLSILYGLISLNNVLQALQIIYPFEENTAVYGPLANVDLATWNGWAEAIGKKGGFGTTIKTYESLDALQNDLSGYIYGYNVAAGRSTYANNAVEAHGGCAGGYVGAMHSGVITNGQAHDTKNVRAVNSAGGFVGEMVSGGAASLGSVSLLGLKLSLDGLLSAVDVFIPVIKVSSVEGYQAGLTVESMASDISGTNSYGTAGGYVGTSVGGQIWGDADEKQTDQNVNGGCKVTKLRRVKGTTYVGGFAGKVTAGSTADVNTNASSGLLQGVLNSLISTPNDLLSLLQATVSTIRGAEVDAADPAWGYVVEGSYKKNGLTNYAKSAGGFAGSLEAAVLGDREGKSGLKANHLRGVTGGLYAGGFFGIADVGSVASVSSNDGSSEGTSILSLIQLGQTSVLDAFRSYIYHADVTGVSDGITIQANTQDSEGLMDSTRYTGNAGGFGGGLLNGSVKDSTVLNLNSVTALNYAGGFIGHLGKNGAVDIDDAKLVEELNLLGATAGVLDVFGSHTDNCTVTGIPDGFTVKSTGGKEMVSGGFAGYSDLSKIDSCMVHNLKKVTSAEIAGGFVGETKMNYIVNTQIDSKLLNVLLKIINELVKALYVPNLEDLGVINLGIDNLLGLKILSDGDLLYVNLFGLKISAALSKADPDHEGATDVAIVTIGDSTIKLPCTKDGLQGDDITPQLEVTLIKGNRSNITSSKVNGITRGYDVYGGGATDSANGNSENGYSGGFIGLNNEGVFEKNTMTLCDVVKGSEEKTGPFAGQTSLKSTYEPFSKVESIEGDSNQYIVYRTLNQSLVKVLNKNNQIITSLSDSSTTDNEYIVTHLKNVGGLNDWKDAKMVSEDNADGEEIGVYESPAKAVLMSDAKVSDNSESLTPEPADTQDPCKQAVDITIQKIWKDWGDWDKKRPDSISVTIMQKYTDAEGQTVEQEYDPDGDPTTSNQITLTSKEDASGWTSTWKKVISGLPVAIEIGKDENGEPVISYYSYTIKEKEVTDYYLSTIEYDNTGYVVTITNRHDVELPLTGGKGIVPLVILAVLLAMYGIYRHDKKKKCGLMAIEGNQSKEEEGKQ